jgi:hypothetical protein
VSTIDKANIKTNSDLCHGSNRNLVVNVNQSRHLKNQFFEHSLALSLFRTIQNGSENVKTGAGTNAGMNILFQFGMNILFQFGMNILFRFAWCRKKPEAPSRRP